MASFFIATSAILLMGTGMFADVWRLGGKPQREGIENSWGR